MGFASVKFNDCFVVENLKIIQGSKGLFLWGCPVPWMEKGGYRETQSHYQKFREELNAAVLEAYEAKLEPDGGAWFCRAWFHQRPAQSRKKRLWSRPKLKNPRKQKKKSQPQCRTLTSDHNGLRWKGGRPMPGKTKGL